MRTKKIIIFLLLLLSPFRLWADGWTPTDGGLVVDLKPSDQILISVMVDHDNNDKTPDREYFVGNYTRSTGDDYFKYTNKDNTTDNNGYYLKLFQQAADATEPSYMSVWTVDTAFTRVKGGVDYALGGITYSLYNDGKTLRTDFSSSTHKFLGHLTDDRRIDQVCDVVFVVPTDQESRTSFDPNHTLRTAYKRTDQDETTGKINGKTGTGFLGMTYREVYMMVIPRFNKEIAYTNAALVTFNTTNTTKKWSNNDITCESGRAAYAYADNKHKPTTRTLFRLYVLNDPINSCNSYFFATDEQDYKRYRNKSSDMTNYTGYKKIYTWDHFTCMAPVNKATSPLYKTDYMRVPVPDSTYYYVGWNNDYRKDAETLGSGSAKSQFTKIRELPLSTMPTLKAPAGAYGQMVVDTSSSVNNLDVKFEPAGYFLKVSTGTNVRMVKTGEYEWTTQDMWTIDAGWLSHSIKATLMTGPEFREDDPGADIAGWSEDVLGSAVPLSTEGYVTSGVSGYARITINSTEKNGNMVFVPANKDIRVHYDNNGFLGTEIPDQYPLGDATTVMIANNRLKTGYTFLGWSKTKAGPADPKYAPGKTIDLASEALDGVLTLYAQATYTGTLQVALSFKEGGKRYFITHPDNSAPRYARARHFDSWENTWQGMENAENEDPNYLSTFELRHPDTEIRKKEGAIDDLTDREYVLDPRHYTMKGYADSLTFYEFFAPDKDEYIGLYYEEALNTILANNTWAGLFTTTSTATTTGWPDYKVPYIDSTKIRSTRYVEEYDPKNKPDSLILKVRKNGSGVALPSFVKYDPATDQFNGVTEETNGTDFQISAVIVADEHYIVLPDTSEIWRDTITFDYHHNEPVREQVWSKLIGKQLMAVMVVDKDTVYFHPNRDKIFNTPQDLYLSKDFRLTQEFTFIHDSRVSKALSAGDSAKWEDTKDYWCNDIVSGNSSPIDVKDGSGNYIDIVDTFRIHISHDPISKIKEYRGRWNARDSHVKANAKGSSRYRDIIVRTKTYHYGDPDTRLVLKPEKESYTFGPLVGQKQQLNFILTQETYRELYDVTDTRKGEEVVRIDTITSQLGMIPGGCSFRINEALKVREATGTHVTLEVKKENKSGVNYDTLVISKININSIEHTLATPVRVPLMQAALSSNELLWSVYDESAKKRHFIMAVGKDDSYTLQFREFDQVNSTLYKKNSSKTQLVKGSNSGDNTDGKYITPWTFGYPNDEDSTQVTLKTESSINKFFAIESETTPIIGGSPSTMTYVFTNVYTNDNANYEEQVKLKYGTPALWKWLKFNENNGSPYLSLETDSTKASVFSWSFLLDEYSLLNNGTYPSQNEAVFGYNSTTPVSVQTRYKAYREYSTLFNNTVTYLCREDEESIANLVDGSKDWKTDTTFTLIRDARTFDAAASSGLSRTTNTTTLTTTVTPAGDSPTNVKIGGKYVDIVDTLDFKVSLKDGAQPYRFKGDWSSFSSVNDTRVKIPLIRKTYHTGPFSTLSCSVENDESSYSFPAAGVDKTHKYVLHTTLHKGTQVLDVDDNVVAILSETHADVTEDSRDKKDTIGMHLKNKALAEIRLMDIYGNKPDWCTISDTTDNSITVKCTLPGIRSPRTAYLYIAYIVTIKDTTRFVNYRLTVSQASSFAYANNQQLIHTSGASGDPMMEDGRQQVHENKRILYYYPDQDTELPVRERSFYGWWRWYREGTDEYGNNVSEADVPDTLWRVAPRNSGGKWDIPFRTIGDSVPDPDNVGKKKLVTMGRWTVFHYRSKDYNNKADPPSKNPRVAPPDTMRTGVNRGKHATLTYVVDLSNYYDNLPMSVKDKNQVDRALMDTMLEITEPTLSLREIFELHPWTEMADTLDHYKSPIPAGAGAVEDKTYELESEKYMEDHVMMAPTGAPLLLQTEQRYIYEHLQPKYKDGKLVSPGHSESLLGYYMHDDNWSTMTDTIDKYGWSRKDSMIWCGGWDADCKWYTYDPSTEKYTECTHPVSEEEDFLQVPAKDGIGTVYYCLRARSKATTVEAGKDVTVDGNFWFNICRYKVTYHNPKQYGPLQEKNGKALITNDEIEQNYEVLERLNFDYIKPGSDYHIYPHPLPWADASYGYTYPETSDLPHNRYHNETDFPNHGEYGLINRIPYSSYWHKMEQHGGAENGYMIYCDGMASAGQVAALTLNTELCEGQKMYFSGYVGNPSNQTGKSNPNFIFSVQGSTNGTTWKDITSYMTGDIKPSNQWSQIFFPIHQEGTFNHFRVRIYNVASSFDGNDFIIDDMCIFATKSPLIAYQANTKCMESGKNDSITQVVLRVDYQGITNEAYIGKNVYYTIEKDTIIGGKDAHTYVPMIGGYLNDSVAPGTPAGKPDTIFGKIQLPTKTYEPTSSDSIFSNLDKLVDSNKNKGYIYENLEGGIRPVLYIVHTAKMTPNNNYTVRMALSYRSLLGSMCAMTSALKVSNRMLLEINGEEKADREIVDMCANTTYDLSIRVKGSLYLDSVAPLDVNGSCVNDWLLYGDTAKVSSEKRYGYYYSDIVKIVKNILRREPMKGTNSNQFAKNLAEVNKNEMVKDTSGIHLITKDHPYDVLTKLVNKGFLTLYKSKITTTIAPGDSLQYVIFPIVGTGSQTLQNANVEVCPTPIFIKLKPDAEASLPLAIGGLHRDSTQNAQPLGVVANAVTANELIKIRVDSITSDMETGVALHSIELRTTDDPNFLEGVHSLSLVPDKVWVEGENPGYYAKGDTIKLRPAPGNTYQMRPGYKYTFDINLMKRSSRSIYVTPGDPTSCRIGRVPFTVSVVPDYLRWNPKSDQSAQWNNAENWIGVDDQNRPIHNDAHFVPLSTSNVLIPALEPGLPYPTLPDLTAPSTYDSVKQVGFEYNKCEAIRFMPGAAMAQQQRLNYDRAVIDMTMPYNKWAFRSAPVKGMLSGDIFMANADLHNETPLWEVGEFDANGRAYTYGNASFWLSVYNRQTTHRNIAGEDSTRTAAAAWSKVTNGLTLDLPMAQGWAVYARTKAKNDAVVRLPKADDIYYYYGSYGEKIEDRYEDRLQTKRGSGAGELAFHPVGTSQNYTLSNAESVSSTSFVFGNPTMGYIDIWGFIADNASLLESTFDYMDESGSASVYTAVPESIASDARAVKDTITDQRLYLPPMHAIVLTKESAGTSLEVTLNANRIVTHPSQIVRPLPSPSSAPRRANGSGLSKGIMTVTAINPVSDRCTSRLQLGQGYHNAVREGEDAILTTINIDNYSKTNAPATPFNIYAAEGGYGLSVDLRDEILNVPISFYMSELPFGETTQLWFTGVNAIEGPLVLYDTWTNTEQPIIDGICLYIETPDMSHQVRYYIRRRGYTPDDPTSPIATDVEHFEMDGQPAVKIVKDGLVMVIRNGHVYTMFGQKVR